MRKAVRIGGRILAGLLGLVLVVVLVSYFVSGARLNKRYQVPVAAIAVPNDSAAIARGRTFATVAGCTDCHTGTLAGQVMIDGFPFAKLASTNLTRGKGGIGATYTDADWERAIRHGVRRDGTPLFIMPSHEYNRTSDAELGNLIAFLKSLPPVDNVTPPRTIYPLARVVHTFGAPLVPAELIDHTTQRNPAPPPGATMEYGEYVAGACRFCHGEDLGGREVGGAAGAPPSPPIGPAGTPSRWTDEQFIKTMRTGVTPEGRTLRNQYMPWKAIGELRDDELRGILMYLKRGPVKEAKS